MIATCEAKHEHWFCTLPAGHAGDHIATDRYGVWMSQWRDAPDWQARALAAEAEVGRLTEQATRHRRAIKAALTLARGPRAVDAVAIEVAITGPLTAEDIGEIARMGVTPRPARDPVGIEHPAVDADLADEVDHG